jgi:hypothetical protein
MPADMRAELDAAAQRRGWSLTQELLWRVRLSLSKERLDHHFPATRALCFLIGEIARQVSYLPPQEEWYRDPFMFKAFKLAVAKLLDALEPAGEMRSPWTNAEASSELVKWEIDSWKTPETAANRAASLTLQSLFQPAKLSEKAKSVFRQVSKLSPDNAGIMDLLVEQLERTFYGSSDARRDLGLDKKGSEDNGKAS